MSAQLKVVEENSPHMVRGNSSRYLSAPCLILLHSQIYTFTFLQIFTHRYISKVILAMIYLQRSILFTQLLLTYLEKVNLAVTSLQSSILFHLRFHTRSELSGVSAA